MSLSTASIILFFAVLLSIFPFPPEVINYMPPWILVVALLFMYRLPLQLGLGWIFICGILSDVLGQVYIGSGALLFLIIGMLFRSFMGYFSYSSGLGKLFLTVLFIVVYELLKVLLFAWLYNHNIMLIQYQPIVYSSLFGILLLSTLHHFLPKK